jgi:RNA polymerase sigma-70 factor (ECF subfamily)
VKGRRWLGAMNGSTALVLDMLAVDVDPCDTTSLVARAREGDALAFGELVAEHEETVLRTAWRLVRNVEDARDIAQEAFLRLHRHLSTLDPDRDPAPWLYRVTVNLGLSALRRRRRRREATFWGARGLAEISAGQPEQERLGDAADARRVLASALDRLSDKERVAIVLRDLEGLEMADVARALGCRRGTVRAHLSRGRLKLRGAIEALGETP